MTEGKATADNERRPAVVAPVEPTVMQHSPGPWRWSSEETALYSSEVDATHLVDGVLKTCQQCGHNPSECGPPVFCFAGSVAAAEEFEEEDVFHFPSEADKRLIEAAPELLAALRYMVAHIGDPMALETRDGFNAARELVARLDGAA